MQVWNLTCLQRNVTVNRGNNKQWDIESLEGQTNSYKIRYNWKLDTRIQIQEHVINQVTMTEIGIVQCFLLIVSKNQKQIMFYTICKKLICRPKTILIQNSRSPKAAYLQKTDHHYCCSWIIFSFLNITTYYETYSVEFKLL